MGDNANAARGYVDEQLKRQAMDLGLSSWKDGEQDAVGAEVLESNQVEMEQIAAFAGLRSGGVGGCTS
jgi:hypothetical protein